MLCLAKMSHTAFWPLFNVPLKRRKMTLQCSNFGLFMATGDRGKSHPASLDGTVMHI